MKKETTRQKAMMTSFPAFGILLRSRSNRQALFSLLQENSGLPGPRANLELGYSFARAATSQHLQEWQWEMILGMASISASKAPANTAKEYLPFCGLVALGALLADGLPRARRRAALAAVQRAASDSRWRTREASAMALQLIGERDTAALKQIVEEWIPHASLIEKRAIIAGLAHPPILGDKQFALFCLNVSSSVLKALSEAGARERRSEEFRVLRQGLGYAVSVFVEKAPEEGFGMLRKAALMDDEDVRWVVRENLKKKRIASKYPSEVKAVADLMGGVKPGPSTVRGPGEGLTSAR